MAKSSAPFTTTGTPACMWPMTIIFFASYMTAAYSEFLRRRGIWHVVEKNKENMAAHPLEIQHFVDELTSYFDSCRTFAEPGDKGVENLTATSRKNAWIAVLNEMSMHAEAPAWLLWASSGSIMKGTPRKLCRVLPKPINKKLKM